MQTFPYVNHNHRHLSAEEMSIRDLVIFIWNGKWWVIGMGFLLSLSALFYSLALPNTYKAIAVLAPAEENSGGGLSAMAGRLGGLATIAGLNLNSGNDKTAVALEVLKSRKFVTEFIKKHELMVTLIAATGWNRESDKLIVDPSIYDEKTKAWVRVPTEVRGAEPTDQEAYKTFIDMLEINRDKGTGFVDLSFEHVSPSVAKQVVDNLVSELNLEIKKRELDEARKSVEYLQNQVRSTSFSEMKLVFYELIEEQFKIILIAEVREEYAFKTIDPAVVPELKSGPNRALLCVLSGMLGGMIGLILAFVIDFAKKEIGNEEVEC